MIIFGKEAPNRVRLWAIFAVAPLFDTWAIYDFIMGDFLPKQSGHTDGERETLSLSVNILKIRGHKTF